MEKKCRKCGKEIPENSNSDLCERCSRRVKQKNMLNMLSTFLWGVVGVAVFVATKGKGRL